MFDPLNVSQILCHALTSHEALLSWLKEANGTGQIRLELLYRASDDGWQAQDFHSRCDNKGATLTVIKCTGGNIFGGDADASWTSNDSYTASPQAFVFALRRPSGACAVKLPLVRHQHAICCSSSYGPTFGRGHDIHVVDGANSNSGSRTNIGHSYQLPRGESAEAFFTGFFTIFLTTFLTACRERKETVKLS